MTDEPEFDPDTPGPPREVHEDATARERSMTAEEWAQLIIDMCDDGAVVINHMRLKRKIANALHEAHAADKAEGVAEEFRRGYLIACCNIANLHNEPVIAADVLMEGNLTEADVADLSEYDAKALGKIRKARPTDPIRQRSEAPDDR